jgi:hypothetical protein
MKKALIAAVVTLAFVPAGAIAQERAGDAALGAVSGAIVLGPIGAVAGAVVGYTAGPTIARSWGLRRSQSARSQPRPRGDAYRGAAAAVPPPPRESAGGNGRVAQMAAPSNPLPQPAPASARTTSAPPVQAFD